MPGPPPHLVRALEIAAMNVVTSTDGLAVLCRQLANSTYVAVDTEFMREQTFWPKLCLVQLASPDVEAIVDPLAEGIDLAPFWELMTNRDVVKVFHAARQDLEIVHVETGTLPAPVFDTQVAAMVCGFGDSISYVNLVKRIAGAGSRQVVPLHRLEPAAAEPESAPVRARRRDASAQGVYEPQADARSLRPRPLARRGNGDPARSRDLRDAAGGRLAAPETQGPQPQVARRHDRARRLARARRPVPGRAEEPDHPRRGALRHREPDADGDEAARGAAHAERRFRALGPRPRDRRCREPRARPRSRPRSPRSTSPPDRRATSTRCATCCVSC